MKTKFVIIAAGLLLIATHQTVLGRDKDKDNVDEKRYLAQKAQSRLDSLIGLRKTEFIDGKLPVYYTPGFREIALEFQKIVLAAIEYYEVKYSKQFNVKL